MLLKQHTGLKRARFIIILVAALATSSQAWCQYSTKDRKAAKQFEEGLQRLSFDPSGAFKCFNKALKADPAFAEVRLTMAGWYMDHDSLDAAEAQYRTFLQQSAGNKHKRWQATAQHDLECIAFRRQAKANPVPFNPTNMGANVNSVYDEYLPTLTADGQTLILTRRDQQQEDFYECRLQEDGQWSPARRMDEPLNSDNNEGAACISQDGRIMILTICEREDGFGRCDLYRSYQHDGKWSRPRNLGRTVNGASWESQPSLSIDGKTLYFVSTRPGGYGGYDIWKTTLRDGHWTQPVNLGPSINTPGDEKSPFIAFDNKTFYFSSNGHMGMGGMDLFVAERIDDTAWSRPKNLGYPINTLRDESSLIVSPDGSTAIFSSDQYGGIGLLDLYSFSLPEELRPQPVEYVDEIVEAAPSLEVGTSIELKNVSFETGKSNLYEISYVDLDKVVELMTLNPTMHIELGGHTDNVGNSAFNQKLSEQRAKAVYDYLIGKGISNSRLSYKGYGPSRPIADNSTEEGRSQNRRTEFTITEK